MANRKITVGTVIGGTHRADDLIPALLGELRRVAPRSAYGWAKTQARRWLDCAPDRRDVGAGVEIVNDLADALGDLAPPYVYFGSNAGDGADYGWWPDMTAAQDDVRCGELKAVAAGDTVERTYRGYVLTTNDHGNVALYYFGGRKYRLIWDCV